MRTPKADYLLDLKNASASSDNNKKLLIERFKLNGSALAEPSGPWHLTFALGRPENLRRFIQIIRWAPRISQVESTDLPLIFLRAQP